MIPRFPKLPLEGGAALTVPLWGVKLSGDLFQERKTQRWGFQSDPDAHTFPFCLLFCLLFILGYVIYRYFKMKESETSHSLGKGYWGPRGNTHLIVPFICTSFMHLRLLAVPRLLLPGSDAESLSSSHCQVHRNMFAASSLLCGVGTLAEITEAASRTPLHFCSFKAFGFLKPSLDFRREGICGQQAHCHPWSRAPRRLFPTSPLPSPPSVLPPGLFFVSFIFQLSLSSLSPSLC